MKQLYQKEVHIPLGDVELEGELILPEGAGAVVVFSHGSGSSRFSPRNRLVARSLHENFIGTLLFDLLSREEDQTYQTRFDIGLLTQRLIGVTRWLEEREETGKCRFGYFGASTGAASALKAAAALPRTGAVVSRGGRPDLAGDDLENVSAPTLLIVGSRDTEVIRLNREAYRHLHCEKELKLIEGATHLFEEPGTLEQVAAEAGRWFGRFLGQG